MNSSTNTSKSHYKIFMLMLGVVVTASTEHITMPIMVTYYHSIYFILFVTTFEGILCYGLLLLIIHKFRKIPLPKNIKIILCAGLVNTIMSFCFVYSANPVRTPVVIQSVFLGLAIFPSVLFTRLILKKKISYDKLYTVPSVLLLFLSVFLATIPLFSVDSGGLFSWTCMYFMAVMLMGIDSILQEKYTRITDDNTIENRLIFTFYTSIVQFICVLAFFWVEIVFGYSNNPWTNFADSFSLFGTDIFKCMILQLFIFVCLALYLISLHLNSISTNYHMILTNLTNQSVAIFFSIFPNLNSGIKYQLNILIPSLLCNILSVILWIKGENKVHDSELPLIEEQISPKNDINNKSDDINTIIRSETEFVKTITEK